MLEHLQAFRDHERIQRGRAESSLNTYEKNIRQFNKWLIEMSSPGTEVINPDDVTSKDIKDFFTFLFYKFKNVKASTHAQKLSALKSFFSYLDRADIIRLNPTAKIPTPKLEKLTPEKFTTKELALLFSGPDRSKAAGLRDLAVLMVLYAAGLRVSEFCDLDIEHINDTGRYMRLKIHGKGSKQRTVSIRTIPAAALRHWMVQRATIPTDDNAVFLSHRHKARLSPEAINDILKKYAVRVGILTSDAFVHKMRATCLADLYDSNMSKCNHCGQRIEQYDIYMLAAFAGHSDPKTMKSYISISETVQKRGIPDRRFTEIMKIQKQIEEEHE